MTNLWFEDDLVDLSNYPYKHTSVDSLDEGIAHVLCIGRAQWADDSLPMGQSGLRAQSTLQMISREAQQLGGNSAYFLVPDRGYWQVPFLYLCNRDYSEQDEQQLKKEKDF